MLCTTLTVPRDYGNPGTDPSQTFQIAVIKDPATGDASAYQGPILMNPGGPGASGFDMVAHGGHAKNAYHAAYDLVGFDPRGIARSHPVQCLTDQEADAIVFQDDRPQTDAERKAFAASVGMIGAHCAANDPDVYRWMGTDNVARDMDVLRAALGRPDLTYLGLSYGSRLGQTYAQLFPDNVRRMVIDGIVPADTTYAEQLRDQVVSFQATFEEYLRTCATRDTCPLSHDPAEAARQFMGMFATLDQSPAVVPGMGTLHDYMLRDAIIPLLYADPEGWGLIDVAIKPVLAGEYKEALDVYLTGTGRRPDGTYADHAHGLVAFDAVTCADNPNDLTIDQVAALADEADRTSPLLGRVAPGTCSPAPGGRSTWGSRGAPSRTSRSCARGDHPA
ncbi:MAG: alpha/beta fold hydrolase [Chloroflexota bacterium]